MFPNDFSTWPQSDADIMLEFEKLGTYVVDLTADFLHKTIDEDNDGSPDVFSGTGRTYFQVGPIADLSVADGGQVRMSPPTGTR